MPPTNSNDRNQPKKGCACEYGVVHDTKKKYKSRNFTPSRRCDHDIFNCPLMQQTPERDKVQYLYADPCFIRQATRRQRAGYNREVEDEDTFYDCEGDSLIDLQRNQQQYNIADVINNIQDPKEFKCLLKEVANTSQILYRCFRRAYHNAKKTTSRPEGLPKIYGKCSKCLRRCREKSQKGTGKRPCEKMNTCEYPPQETAMPQAQNSKEVVDCDKADCDCPKKHKVGEQHLSDNDKHESKQCDCLDTRHELGIETTQAQDNKLCGLPLGSVVNLNGFEVFKLCPSSDIEYKDMSFCEKCARLRGEPLTREEKPKDSAMGGAEIIRCPEKDTVRNESHESSQNLIAELSGTQIIRRGTTANSKEIVAEKIRAIMASQQSITTNLRAPTVNDKQCEELHQFPTTSSCSEPFSRFPCYRHPAKVSTPAAFYQQSSNQTYPLHPTIQTQRTCPCHRTLRSQYVPTKRIRSSTCHRDKSSSRSNSVHLQPIAFTLPINLQIQTRSGETRFFQTEVQMKACAKPTTRKPKSRDISYAAEPIRTATIAAATSASQTQPENVFRFQQQAKTNISEDVFYSCSSSASSVMETVPSIPDKPCEALLEIFEIIKKRVTNNKKVPKRIIKDLAAFDINECLTKKTTCPEPTPPPCTPAKILSCEQTPVLGSTEAPEHVGTEKTKTVADLETQTEPLMQEQSSPSKSLPPVSVLSQYIEETLNKPKIPPIEQSLDKPNIPPTEPLLYYKGNDCFDLPLTSRPRHSQPPADLLQEVIDDLEQKSKTTGKPIITEFLSDDITHEKKGMPTEDSRKVEVPTVVPPISEQISQDINKELGKVKTPQHATSTTSILPATPPTPPPPHTPPPPLPTPAVAPRMSAIAQTDILSASAYAHLKRNDMRKEIMNNLEELVKPTSSKTKSKYEPDEKVEILRDLHKLFTPKRADGQVPKEVSRDSVLEDINLLLNPHHETHKTMSSSTISTGRQKSKSSLRKTKSTEVILKDIRYVLNPKGGEKPSKRFSMDHREHVLEHLHSLLTPRNQKKTKPEPGTRESVLQDLRLTLDTPEAVDPKSLRKPPKPPTKPKPHAQGTNLKSSSDDNAIVENKQRNKSEILDKPKAASLKKDLQLQLPSSSEDISAAAETNKPHTSRKAPPTPKKPKSKTSRPVDENDNKTDKVDNSELIPSSKERNPADQTVITQIEDGISLVSTSSDTFFINLDDYVSDAYPQRLSSFQRRSQFYPDTDHVEWLYKRELRNVNDLKNQSETSENRNQTRDQDVTSKLYANIEEPFKKPLGQQKMSISQMYQTDNKVNMFGGSPANNARSSAIRKEELLKTSLPETSTNENRSHNRNSLTLSPLRASMNLMSRHQSLKIEAEEDFKPFNRKYKKRLQSERNSVIAGDKRKSIKSLEYNEQIDKRPETLYTENQRPQHKHNESIGKKTPDSRSKKPKQAFKSIENL